MHPNAIHRLQILEILYRALESKPRFHWVNERELKKLGDIDFPLEVLKKLGHANQDGLNWQITGDGILEYESAQQEP